MSLLYASIYFASTAPLICLYVSSVSRFACLRRCKKWPPDSPDSPKTQIGAEGLRISTDHPTGSAEIRANPRIIPGSQI
jgi:hypothetical protein